MSDPSELGEANRLDQIEQLLASAARYAESANQRVEQLAAIQQTHEATLKALLTDRQENRQQNEQLHQLIQQGQQQNDQLRQMGQQGQRQTEQHASRLQSLQEMLAAQQQMLAAQQQLLVSQQQQLDDQRRTNAAALDRLDAILNRLMDRLDNLEAA